MALFGLTSTEFLPTIRFNAREGVFSRADRVMGSDGTYTTQLAPINDTLASDGALIDVGGIEIGWIRFEGGVDIVTQHHSLGLPGPKPSDLHKEGILMELWLPGSIAEGAQLREWTHTSNAVKNSVNELHTAWEKDDEYSDGKADGTVVPHVKIDVEDFKTRNGVFRKPKFEIIGWVLRPEEWKSRPIAAAERLSGESTQEATTSNGDLPF